MAHPLHHRDAAAVRKRIVIALLPAVLIVALAGVFRWLLFTESGAEFAWQRIAGAVPGDLRAERVEGALKRRLRLSGVRYQDGDLRVMLDSAELQLDLDLWPLALSVGTLELGELSVDLPPGTEEGGDAVAALEALALPFPIEFGRLAAGGIRVRDATGASLVEIDKLFATLDWFRSIRIRQLQADLPDLDTRLEGGFGLGLQKPFALELDARLITQPESAGWEAPLTAVVQASGDLGSLQLDASIEDPAVTISGTLEESLAAPRWNLSVEAAKLALPPGAAGSAGALRDALISSRGRFDSHGLEASGKLEWAGEPVGLLTLSGTGDTAGIELDRVRVEAGASLLSGTASLAWSPSTAVEAEFVLEGFDPAPWWPDWGAAGNVSGQGAIRWRQGRLDLEGLSLVAAGFVERLSGSGTADLETGRVEAALEWRSLAWPPGAPEPALLSREGRGTVSGKLDDWRFGADLAVDGRDLPPGRLRLQAEGDRSQLRFEAPEGEVLGGRFAARGGLRWGEQGDWSVQVTLDEVSTEPLLPAFPGRLSGDLAAEGALDLQRVDVALGELNGVIRGREVEATGGLSWRPGQLQADRLRIRSGRSELALDGAAKDANGLEAVARVADLGDFLDQASGRLQADAWLRWTGAEPELKLNLLGDSLAWQSLSVQQIAAAAPDPAARALSLQLAGLRWPDGAAESFSLETSGDVWLQRVDLGLQLPGGEVEARLEDGAFDWSQPSSGSWRGTLAQLRVDGAEAVGSLELEQAAPLQISAEALVLEQACLRGEREGRLCLAANLQPRGERTVEASLERFSPNSALAFTNYGIELSHHVTGTAGWRHRPGGRAEARVDLAISPGEIVFEDEDEPVLATGRGSFGFAIEDGRLYGGHLDIPLVNGGGVDMDFDVPDLSGGLESEVRGRLLVELDSIQPLLEMTSLLEGSSGPLTADMRFSGTLGDPRFTGYMSLVRGQILHFPTGLRLENFQLAGAVYDYDQTDLRGTFKAGDGQGSIRAVINFDDMLAPEFLVELAGKDLRLVDVPDLRVDADPDLRLTWRGDALRVGGRVAVPSARLSPRYMPTESATESQDVVIVAGTDPLAIVEAPRESSWRVLGTLDLELGRDVELVLERARARLGGKATFSWSGDPLPLADGGFSLSGEIDAYGQLLRIEEGRVSFAGRPADNPFLSITAERDIYGNSQIRNAGVLVTGTLKNPLLEPYTEPLTTRERALALLVTGSDFDYEQGVGAVRVGMYVAPKLYVSYGVGLFDDQNVISARYELGRGFAVRAVSGQRETGVDIDYTIER